MPAPCSKKSGSQVDCTTQTRGILSTRQLTGIDGYDPVTVATGLSRLRTATSFSTRWIISASVKAGANFSPRSTLAICSIFSGVRRGSMRVKAKPCFSIMRLKVASIGDELNSKALAGGRVACNSLGDLDHSARFSKIECTRSEEEKFSAIHVCSHEHSKPSECPLHEWLCIFLDAHAVSDDQLVEIPRKQLFE